jgi:predicted Zn-dependent protease
VVTKVLEEYITSIFYPEEVDVFIYAVFKEVTKGTCHVYLLGHDPHDHNPQVNSV